MKPTINNVGQLKKEGYQYQGIKTELRKNLILNIQNHRPSFKGIVGYENSVIPELERAILSGHNINFLGLRGQAKTRLARLMVQLLDEWIPVVEGSEINDDPFMPISRYAKQRLEKEGDKCPIEWMHRDERFAEKLATPDVTVADIIGDVDPIKAANLKLSYADDRVIHYGMIPRANRCIFVINELPDLQARIQVALFNILQEGDIQIRGFKLRLALDMQFVFTANPEDYTNRGSIVTPLKDRIGSQILTHYPSDIKTARAITEQEAHLSRWQKEHIHLPTIARDLLEQIGFQARESEFVDVKSGISARMSITAMQNLMSTAERRALLRGDEQTRIRVSDFIGIIPAITGKVELVYEGEQEGAANVAMTLIGDAIKTLFSDNFPKINKLEKPGADSPYQSIIDFFYEESALELLDEISEADYTKALDNIGPLHDLVLQYHPKTDINDLYFLKEFVLWALVEYKKLSKERYTQGIMFTDTLGSFYGSLES